MTTILIVDDEPQILRALCITLRARGLEVLSASTGAQALELAASTPLDLVVLDLGLPDIDGNEVLRRLRGWTSVPVIVLSARTDSSDKVSALDAGADDYVTKPFAVDEFTARIRAALRRGSTDTEPGSSVVETAAFTVDLARTTVVRHGSPVHLTPTEWGILEILVRNPGTLVTQQEILRTVWGPHYEKETHYLRIYLAQLRRKLEDTPTAPRYLLTEAGRGYRFIP